MPQCRFLRSSVDLLRPLNTWNELIIINELISEYGLEFGKCLEFYLWPATDVYTSIYFKFVSCLTSILFFSLAPMPSKMCGKVSGLKLKALWEDCRMPSHPSPSLAFEAQLTLRSTLSSSSGSVFDALAAPAADSDSDWTATCPCVTAYRQNRDLWNIEHMPNNHNCNIL